MTLKPALSAYLDHMRFIAALAALLRHMDQDGLSMAWMPLSRFSHAGGVFLFALFVSSTRDTTAGGAPPFTARLCVADGLAGTGHPAGLLDHKLGYRKAVADMAQRFFPVSPTLMPVLL